MERKHKGALSELTASAYLLSLGYEVFRNVSAFGDIDIIATGNGETLFIDVKTVYALGQGSITKRQAELGVVALEVVGQACGLNRTPRIQREREEVICEGCQKSFLSDRHNKFCSRVCGNKFRAREQKAISLASIGEPWRQGTH